MSNLKPTVLSIIAGASLLAVSSLCFANCPQPSEIHLGANKYWVSQAGGESWKSRTPSQAGGQVATFKMALAIAYDTTKYPPTTYKGMVCMYADNASKSVTLVEVTPKVHSLDPLGLGHWQRVTQWTAACVANDVISCSFD